MSPIAEPPVATAPPVPPMTKPGDEHYHIFHADAHVLSGELTRPIQQKIEQQIPVSLKDRRGGHLTRVSDDFTVEGFVSYKRGLTRVSGSPSSKPRPGQQHVGWTTLSTSILEYLNVFEIITVDRVVSQVSTDHSYEDGRVPFVTFLGTQFSNMRVGGFTAIPVLNLRAADMRPANDLPFTTETNFLNAIASQNGTVLKEPSLPAEVKKRYAASLENVEKLLKLTVEERAITETSVLFSLVSEIIIDKNPASKLYPIPGLTIAGNVITIPEFGAVALGEVELKIEAVKEREFYEPPLNGSAGAGEPYLSHSFEVTMLRMNLGCVGAGTVNAGSSKTNGTGRP
jgi:hypothetical protein